MSPGKLRQAVQKAFLFKWCVYIIHCIFPLHQNHFWRQFDTLGVSIRYFQRFFLPGNPEPFFQRFLPAILQAGGSVGVTPMEFPVLNLLTAPLWYFDSKWGRVFSSLFLVMITYGLAWFLFRKRRSGEGIAYLLLPFVSFTAENFYKFIPDVIAGELVCVSVVFALERRFAKAALFCLAGALMKPPALCVLFLLLLFRRNIREILAKDLVWMSVAGLGALFYYTKGVFWISSFSDVGGLFFIAPRDPFKALQSVFSDPVGYFWFLNSQAVYWGGTFALGAWWLLSPFRKEGLGPLLVFGLSILFVVALDGSHSIIHNYYYAGAAFPVCILIERLISRFRPGRWPATAAMGLFMVSTLLIHPVELVVHDFRGIGRVLTGTTLEDDCDWLKSAAKDWPWNRNVAFRSSDEAFPKLGVCFREKVGDPRAPYGFFLREKGMPAGCVVELSRGEVVLARCSGES